MYIYIELSGWLNKEVSKENIETSGKLNISKDEKVLDVLKVLGLSYKYPVTIIINGKKAKLDTSLKENDFLKIIPIVGGG